MVRKGLRALVLGAAGGLLVWRARLWAHSKTPRPEGHWREVAPDDLL